MSSLFSKTLVYLGLVDEDQVDADQPVEAVSPAPVVEEPARIKGAETIPAGRRVEPPPTSRAATRPSGRTEVLERGDARPIEVQSVILLVEEFGDARILADRVRDRTPVVLDLRSSTGDLQRRVIDFSSGLIYALDGTMRKVGDGLILVLPPRVGLSRDEKRRLASLGAYELEDFDD